MIINSGIICYSFPTLQPHLIPSLDFFTSKPVLVRTVRYTKSK